MKLLARLLPVALAGTVAGCAALIGASFDEATLAINDASRDVNSEGLVFPDASVVDPHSISGLALWLDSTQQLDVNGTAVTRWHDLSGNSRDAVPAGNSSGSPTVATGIHGLTTVHFTAASAQTLVTTWVGASDSAMTIFVVANGYLHSAVRFQLNVSVPPFIIFPFDLNDVWDGGSDFGFSISNEPFVHLPVDRTKPQLLTARFGDSGTSTYNDGQLAEQRTPASSSLPVIQTLYIGGGLPVLSYAQFLDGDLGEVLIYDTSLSDPEREAIEAYLRDKWGI